MTTPTNQAQRESPSFISSILRRRGNGIRRKGCEGPRSHLEAEDSFVYMHEKVRIEARDGVVVSP